MRGVGPGAGTVLGWPCPRRSSDRRAPRPACRQRSGSWRSSRSACWRARAPPSCRSPAGPSACLPRPAPSKADAAGRFMITVKRGRYVAENDRRHGPRLLAMIQEAFGAESGRLSEVAAGLDDAAFARPTRCDPWTVAELLFHVGMTMRRLPGMLAAPR